MQTDHFSLRSLTLSPFLPHKSTPFAMASSFRPVPLLLKDFLRDDPHASSSDDFLSCSTPSYTTVRQLLATDLAERDLVGAKRLQRSRSRAAAATAISAIQRASEAVANAIKLLPFSSPKSPAPLSRPKESTLRRSFSEKLRRSFWEKTQREELGNRVGTRVRDEESGKKRTKPLDAAGFFSSITSVNTVTASRRSRSSSSSSSWSETDFTVRSSSGSSVYSGENEGYDGKNAVPAQKSRSCGRAVGGDSMSGGDSMGTATCCREAAKVAEGKEEPGRPYEEQEQLSPVSVLDFPYEDDETLSSPSSSAFQQSLANVERTKQQLLQKIQRFERLAELDPVDLEKRLALSEYEQEDEQGNDLEDEGEEDDRPTKLLEQLKASCYGQQQEPHLKKTTTTTDRLLLAFFREGLSLSSSDELEMGLLREAMNWANGGAGKTALGVKVGREIHVREMEKEGRWSKFEDEGGELAAELAVGLVGQLLEELLLDLVA